MEAQRKPRKKSTLKGSKLPQDFGSALKSFQGYLEGTEKSLHTIKSYRLDLLAFDEFLRNSFNRAVPLDQVGPKDLDAYHANLKAQGLKTNTRRRMLMTVRRFLSFLHQRKKIPLDLGRTLLTPLKLERIPLTIPMGELLKKILSMPQTSAIEKRNRVLLWTLAETGCLVSEIGKTRFDNFVREEGAYFFTLDGKSPRKVPITRELFEAAISLKSDSPGRGGWVFLGHNKFGSLGGPISSRGVELLVEAFSFAHEAEAQFKEMTPRIFRHSAVMHWFTEGVPADEVQKRLGLKSQYAFRAFQSVISKAETSAAAKST
jgi:site-specific recombinase XerD